MFRFSFERETLQTEILDATVQKIPFLRLTIAMALGIIAASQIQIHFGVSAILLIISFFSLLFLNKIYQYQYTILFGIGVHLLFFFLGTLSFELYNKKPLLYKNGEFLATILESPQKKENSYKSLLLLDTHLNSEHNEFSEINEKVLVYFETDSNVQRLTPGDEIVFSKTPQAIKNNGNPFEFDYKKYLEKRKIYRRLYLPSDRWQKTNQKKSYSLIILAERSRDKLLRKYRKQNLGEKELEILSALTLGYKRELDPEIKRVFSSAGAMHVLAVSGLHVGIIYWVLVSFLGFIKRKRAGQFTFVLFALFCLWAYAFITGLSPSVMRATTMFSFIVIGDSIKRHGNIYNSLAASAVFLLLINPTNLFEVGFQLSYSAVFGIVFLQPKMSKIFTPNNKLLKYIWVLLTVSIAAQISTFPISVFYFSQFPTYFFISNLFVIPAVFLLIPLGILLLIFSAFPLISNILSVIINSLVSLIYFLLKEIESLPFAVQKISITQNELVFISLILIFLSLLLKTHKIKYFKMTLVSILCLTSVVLIKKIHSRNTNTLIIYNTTDNFIIHLLTSNKTNYVISDKPINNNDYEKNYIENTIVKMNLNPAQFLQTKDSFLNSDLFMKKGIVLFKEKLILINREPHKLPDNLHPDFIINPQILLNDKSMPPNTPVIITNQRVYRKNNHLTNQIFNVSNQGAYQKNW